MYKLEEILDTVICEDTLKVLPKIPDNSINMLLTSPPYWKGFAYESYFNSYNQYLEWSERYMREIYRVLKEDGTFFLNISNDSETTVRAYELMWIATMKVMFKLHDTIIWYCYNRQPANTDKQLTNQTEYIFMLVKKSSLVRLYKENVTSKNIFETKNIGNVWKVNFSTSKEQIFKKSTKSKFGHAGFPKEIPKTCIELTTLKDDIVMDCFCGSGIALIEAKKLGRHYIGIDKESEFCNISEEKLEKTIKNNENRFY